MPPELILIIEDREKNRKLMREVLQVAGSRTVEAETAEEGIRVAREVRPALVLMDLQLLGMDGFTARAVLRADAATKTIDVRNYSRAHVRPPASQSHTRDGGRQESPMPQLACLAEAHGR